MTTTATAPTGQARPTWDLELLEQARLWAGELEDMDRRATELNGYGGNRLEEAAAAEAVAEEEWGAFLTSTAWAELEAWIRAGLPDVAGYDDTGIAYLRNAGEQLAHLVVEEAA